MPRIKKQELTISEIREILLRHEGAMSEIARALEVRPAAISQTLTNKMSSTRILAACRAEAEKFLRQESRQGSAA
jgi:hypothetical protein